MDLGFWIFVAPFLLCGELCSGPVFLSILFVNYDPPGIGCLQKALTYWVIIRRVYQWLIGIGAFRDGGCCP